LGAERSLIERKPRKVILEGKGVERKSYIYMGLLGEREMSWFYCFGLNQEK